MIRNVLFAFARNFHLLDIKWRLHCVCGDRSPYEGFGHCVHDQFDDLCLFRWRLLILVLAVTAARLSLSLHTLIVLGSGRRVESDIWKSLKWIITFLFHSPAPMLSNLICGSQNHQLKPCHSLNGKSLLFEMCYFLLLFCPSWPCTIMSCISRFTSLWKNSLNLLEFLAEAFWCHMHLLELTPAPVRVPTHGRLFRISRRLGRELFTLLF